MKSLLIGCLFVAALGYAAQATAAEKSSGVYKTAADYQSGRLTAEGSCDSKKHKLELHDVLGKPYVHVTHDGEKTKYMKSDLFGFRSCDGKEYRFVAGREYLILEARTVYLYRHERSVPQPRGGSRNEPAYFFSVGGDGGVLPLTMANLKRAFPTNHRFHDDLDRTFGTDQDLIRYDDFHKMYKVNRLLVAESAGTR